MTDTASDPLDDFERRSFTHDGKTRTVYRQGTGPGVIVISEMPGITPEVAEFARRVTAIGCTVAMPDVFGEAGRPLSVPYALRSMIGGCVSSEFKTLAKGRRSPVTDWLRALARDLHAEVGGPGVGAVGMCFTGGFALAMLLDECLIAPVLSQPSLPFPVTAAHRRDVGLSDEDLATVRRRVDDGVCVLGLRFTHDRLVPRARFQRLREELGDGFVGVEIDSSPGNPWGNKKVAHSVLTNDLVDEPGHPTREALDQVLDLFRERLLEST